MVSIYPNAALLIRHAVYLILTFFVQNKSLVFYRICMVNVRYVVGSGVELILTNCATFSTSFTRPGAHGITPTFLAQSSHAL